MEEFIRYSRVVRYSKLSNMRFYSIKRNFLKENLLNLLLDSSLISQTKNKIYTHKIIHAGNYIQVYDYKQISLHSDCNYQKIDKKNNIKINNQKKIKQNKEELKISNEYDKYNNNPLYKHDLNNNLIDFKHIDINIKEKQNKIIELKNLNRCKFELQRIVKANENIFKTFITLTFEDNITDIELANKNFNSFRTYIKRLFPSFAYVCVPEYQKRGSVHYHMICNIPYNSFLLNEDEKKLWNPTIKEWHIGKTLKNWNKGYSFVKKLNNINVIGYLCKYMTKDIDNRLWGKRKYYYSQNLIKPKTLYLNENDLNDFKIIVDISNNGEIIYNNDYINVFDKSINFKEYKLTDNLVNIIYNRGI